MIFRLEFDTDNAAFEEDKRAFEIARILGEVATDVLAGLQSGGVWDANGNFVGRFVHAVD